MLLDTILVGLGGALGAVSRGAISSVTKRAMNSEWPWATFLINLTASVLAGVVMRLTLVLPLYLLLTSGFLGGFSTMSSMNFEAVSLQKSKHHHKMGFIYVLATYIVCLAGALVGFAIGGLF